MAQALSEQEPVHIRPPRNLSKAVVRTAWQSGRAVVVKSVEDRPWICRRALGGWLLRREAAVLRRLEGAPFVPQIIEATRHRLVMELVPGETIRAAGRRGLDEVTIEAMLAAVRELHVRGWAHGDLGPRDVILTPEGRIVLLDFATAVGPGSPPLLWRLLRPLWQLQDRRRVGALARRFRRRRKRRKAKEAQRKAPEQA